MARAPSYKIAQHLTDVLNWHLHLSNQYNVKNSITLAKNLTKIEINENHKLITYDIKDLYVNIPIQETLKITESMLNKENNTQTTKHHHPAGSHPKTKLFWIPKQHIPTGKRSLHGLTHIRHNGRNISATHRKHTHKTLTRHKKILYYTRYVDDILIIYDTRHISDNTIQKYNQIHKNLQLNPTHEDNGQMNFLDLTIIRNNSKLEIDIYRKPITMNTIINYDSNHPTKHKTTA